MNLNITTNNMYSNISDSEKINIVMNNMDYDISDSEKINIVVKLRNAITNSDIEVIQELFTVSTISYYDDSVSKIIRKPELYSTLEFLLEYDNELCKCVSKIVLNDISITNYICHNIIIPLLNICIKYFPSDNLLQDIFNQSIRSGKLYILDKLFEIGYDIILAFDKTCIRKSGFLLDNKYMHQITFTTFMHLNKFGVDILKYVNIVYMDFCHAHDVDGLRFCLENGIDADDVFRQIRFLVNIDIIKCLLEHGGNLNKLQLGTILYIMTDGGNCPVGNFPIIVYLVQHGLSITVLNKLLLEACRMGNIDNVKYLLDNGVDIHYRNNNILNFVSIGTMGYGNCKWFSMAKFLIKNGAVPDNPLYTFCAYIIKSPVCGFDEDLFTYFLDLGIDPNSKFDLEIRKNLITRSVEYILDVVAYLGQLDLFILCLKYGADPYINNHSPLTIAIKENRLDIIKLLLDLGSVLDSEFTYKVNSSTIDLLDQYQINHKLIVGK